MTIDTRVHKYLSESRRALLCRNPRLAYEQATEGLIRGCEAPKLCLAAAEALHHMESPVLAQLFEAVADAPDRASAWLELGAYVSLGAEPDFAVSVFDRALALDGTSLEAATSLALAHAAAFEPKHGCYVLAGRRLVDFRSQFAMAWCSLLCGELDGADRFIDQARCGLRRSPVGDRTAQYHSWFDGFEESIARFARVGDPRRHVRDWHFIQYGAAILDCCEFADVAGGRYVSTWPTYRDLALRLGSCGPCCSR